MIQWKEWKFAKQRANAYSEFHEKSNQLVKEYEEKTAGLHQEFKDKLEVTSKSSEKIRDPNYLQRLKNEFETELTAKTASITSDIQSTSEELRFASDNQQSQIEEDESQFEDLYEIWSAEESVKKLKPQFSTLSHRTAQFTNPNTGTLYYPLPPSAPPLSPYNPETMRA